MGSPAGIDDPVDQGEGTAFLMGLGDKSDGRVLGIDSLDDRGTVELLRAGGNVHRMELVQKSGNASAHGFGHGREIHGAGGRINDRGIGDSYFRGDLGAGNVDGARTRRDRGDSPADIGYVPIGYPGVVGVESVGAVVLGDNINHVMGSAADSNIRHVKGLGINLAVNRVGKKLAEGGAVDIGGGEGRFVLVPAIAGLVIVIGREGSLGENLGTGKDERAEKSG